MKFYIGIDVGGTKIAYGLFDEARKLLVRKQTASDDQKEGQEFFEPVLEIIRECYFGIRKIIENNVT